VKARRFPRGVYRRGDVLWIRFKAANGRLSRESTGPRDVKGAESILAKRRTEVAMLRHFPSRRFEQVTFDQRSSQGRGRPLGIVGEPLPDDPELDLQRGYAPRAVRHEPRAGDPSVPRASRARPVPERGGVPSPARSDTPAPEEEDDDVNLFENGGVDGTRTRDLRRDRRKE
jgi:hypothetical protein